MADLNEKTVAELVKLGRLSSGPQEVPGGNIPFVLVPDGCKVQALPELLYNDHADRPERIKASVIVLDPESFVEYNNLFGSEDSRVFANEPEQKLVAILDYHLDAKGGRESSPDWCQHRVTLQMRLSDSWRVWITSGNKQMTQAVFAEFLEQNAIDITKPDPSHMIDVARDLQATTEVEFGSGLRMQDGQVRFKYTETTKASVGAGQLAVPEQFVVTIPPFVGNEPMAIQALLRFRVKEGKLVIWYTLVRPDEVLRQAFLAARNQIAQSLSITIINGSPQ